MFYSYIEDLPGNGDSLDDLMSTALCTEKYMKRMLARSTRCYSRRFQHLVGWNGTRYILGQISEHTLNLASNVAPLATCSSESLLFLVGVPRGKVARVARELIAR